MNKARRQGVKSHRPSVELDTPEVIPPRAAPMLTAVHDGPPPTPHLTEAERLEHDVSKSVAEGYRAKYARIIAAEKRAVANYYREETPDR